MPKAFLFGVLALILLGACTGSAPDQQAANAGGESKEITVYRSPT